MEGTVPKAKSLSQLLADTQSPLRTYISTISPQFESTPSGTLGARTAAELMGVGGIAAIVATGEPTPSQPIARGNNADQCSDKGGGERRGQFVDDARK